MKGNYVVYCKPDSVIGDRRFYTWSGNTAAATGKRNVFMLDNDKDVSILKNTYTLEAILSHYPMYKEYKADHTSIDGKIDFSADISLREVLKNKFYEIFDNKLFKTEIKQLGRMVYIPTTE